MLNVADPQLRSRSVPPLNAPLRTEILWVLVTTVASIVLLVQLNLVMSWWGGIGRAVADAFDEHMLVQEIIADLDRSPDEDQQQRQREHQLGRLRRHFHRGSVSRRGGSFHQSRPLFQVILKRPATVRLGRPADDLDVDLVSAGARPVDRRLDKKHVDPTDRSDMRRPLDAAGDAIDYGGGQDAPVLDRCARRLRSGASGILVGERSCRPLAASQSVVPSARRKVPAMMAASSAR
jgi:hypothetical protein